MFFVKAEFTTVRVSKDTFSKLLKVKHKLETIKKKSCSFDSTINHLIDGEK